jgi:hypothetical protein
VWIDPYYQAARQNLNFARRNVGLEAPELSWFEVISTWLPVNWWPWITAASLWLSVVLLMAPGILRQPKRDWHQAAAAFGLMVFLLSLPAHLGVHARSRIGVVLQKDTSLRLTPTREAQALTRLAPGEPARLQRVRGDYALVRMGRVTGWIERNRFGLVSPESVGPRR